MRKRDELTDPFSCTNRARAWARHPRMRALMLCFLGLGENRPDDPQIVEAVWAEQEAEPCD